MYGPTIAARNWTFNFLVLPDGSESNRWVSPRYLKVIRHAHPPWFGRAFDGSDTPDGLAIAIILGHELWPRRFNGDPEIIGQNAQISRYSSPPQTVVGGMPPNVRFLPSPGVLEESELKVVSRARIFVGGNVCR